METQRRLLGRSLVTLASLITFTAGVWQALGPGWALMAVGGIGFLISAVLLVGVDPQPRRTKP